MKRSLRRGVSRTDTIWPTPKSFLPDAEPGSNVPIFKRTHTLEQSNPPQRRHQGFRYARYLVEARTLLHSRTNQRYPQGLLIFVSEERDANPPSPEYWKQLLQ